MNKTKISFTLSIALLLVFLGGYNPTVSANGNLVTNSDFEAVPVTHVSGWDIFPSGYTNLGWNVQWYGGYTPYQSVSRPSTANAEFHKSGNLANTNDIPDSWLAQSGSQYIELDSDWNGHTGSLNNEPASVTISQNIPTCVGGDYTLSYYWSPRPGVSNNALEVRWNGSLVAAHSGSGGSGTVWNLGTYPVSAAGVSSALSFTETGTADSLGMFLDNVSVILQAGTCDPGKIDIVKTVSSGEVYPGETVIYSYAVTNPYGDRPLTGVVVSDDKCSPVNYVSGDDGDNVLEKDETWHYTCSTILNETTTNIGTASATDPFDNTVTDTDTKTVAVKDVGCTLTQGYWKNHANTSKHSDPNWDGLEDETFFLSGAKYLDVLRTSPGGNAYYQLAHQYIAAKLNDFTAFMPANVSTAFSAATSLFNIYTPAQIAALKGSNATRQQFISLAGTLGNYNEGMTIVPHCSEVVWRLVETLEISAYSSVIDPVVVDSMTLENGKSYKIQASGTADANDGIIFDAKYSERNNSGSWTDLVQNYEGYGPELLDLLLNSGSGWYSPAWGIYNPLHVYEVGLIGNGSSLGLKINDIYPVNNSGSLTVKIYEMM